MNFKSFFSELKRRNIYRVAVVYGITGWVIVQIASVAANTFGAPPWVMKMIITLILLGFPIAMVMTWAFEVTPEGVRKTKPAENETAETKTGSEQYFWVSISVVVVLLFGGWWYLTMEPPENTKSATPQNITDRSIAVLPFENHGGEGKADPLARGIHDDLLTRLSNISDLRVISRTSVEKYRNTDIDIPAIADSLNVRWILEGGVLEVGDQVKVNAQLINPKNDSHVWAKDYQRELTADNFFAIQGNITREIANTLQARLSANEQKRIAGAPTDNLDAYRLYVRGRSNLNSRSKEGMQKAVGYFQQAIQQDSTYALAWAGLADAIGLFNNKSYASPNRPLPDYEKTVRRAVELDPNLAEAQASIGFFHFDQYNGPAALKHLKRATELKPSYAQAHHWLGLLFLHIGRPKPALQHLRLATDLNPNHFAAHGVLVQCLMANHQYKEALGVQEVIRDKELYPESWGSNKLYNALIQIHLNNYDKAINISDQMRLASDDPIPIQAANVFQILAYIAQGDTASAHQLAKEVGRPDIFSENFFIQAAMGKIDTLYSNISGSVTENGRLNLGIRYYFPNQLRSFRNDPRFEELIKKMNRHWSLNPDGSLPKETNS
jgi:TolB-like protein